MSLQISKLFANRIFKDLIVCLSIAGVSVFLTKACMKDKPIPIVVPTMDTAKTYTDINNKIHSVITQQEIKQKQQQQIVDSLKTVLKAKEVESVTKVADEGSGTFKSKTDISYLPKDTIYSVSKKDHWIDISAIAGRDSGTIKFNIWDTVTITSIKKKSGIFSTTRYIDIQHSNPYIKTVSGYSLMFKEKEPIFVIGPYIGYGYNGNKFSPNIGISVTVPLIRLKR